MLTTLNLTERTARAALTALFEPGDYISNTLVGSLGAQAALQVAAGELAPTPFADVTADILDEVMGDRIKKWQQRLPEIHPEKDLATIERLGGGFLIPGDEHWPQALNDLDAPPYGLWYRGDISNSIPAKEKVVALIGSRDSSSYGLQVAGDMASGLVRAGFTILSDLSYGVAGMTHKVAMAAGSDTMQATIAVVAGGIDRVHPAGHQDLAEAILGRRGLILSEQPPGTGPTRQRSVQRNRILAALAGLTCVVEARYRSSALSTAQMVIGYDRILGAVPGSVYSSCSAGAHMLIKDGAAIVTGAEDILDLLAEARKTARVQGDIK